VSGTAQSPAMEPSDSRLFALVSYGLFLAALVTGFTALAGVVLAYIKRADTRGTIWESHFTNLIRLFWLGLAVFAVWLVLVIGGVIGAVRGMDHNMTPPLAALLPVAWLISVVYLVWYVYRTARGLLRAVDGQPYA
jgi:uncharacterized membrane protein